MSLLDNLMNRIKPEPDDGYIDNGYNDSGYDGDWAEEPEEEPRARRSASRTGFFQRKVIDGAGQTSRIVTVKPKGMEDCKTICNYLLDGQSVILNMEGVQTDIAQRIIDFSLGATYAIEGNLQEVSRFIFVASPMNVELTGDFQEDISKTGTMPLNRQGFSSSIGNSSSNSSINSSSGFRFNN